MALRNPLAELILSKVGWEWMSADQLIADLIPQIPPGPAMRAYRQAQENWNRKTEERRNSPEYNAAKAHPQTLTSAQMIRSGARAIINTAIGSLRKNGYIETNDDRKNRMIRRKERRQNPCPKCAVRVEIRDGALVELMDTIAERAFSKAYEIGEEAAS